MSEPGARYIPEYRGGARAPDRDAEVERLKGELREPRARERAARTEVHEAHKRFEHLRTTSKNFAASMRASAAERHRSRQRIAAQYAVARVLAEAGEVEEAAARMLRILVEDLGWAMGVFWSLEGETLRCGDLCPRVEEGRRAFARECRETSFRRGEGLPGRAWAAGRPVWVEDYAAEGGFSLREAAGRAGLRSALAFPVCDGGRTSGVFELFGEEAATPDEEMLRVASVIGAHVGQFAERRRAEKERERVLRRERAARAEANAARRRATGILESITDAFTAFDRDWRYTYINRAAAELLRVSGRDPEYLLGKVVWEELPEFKGTVFEAGMLRATREGETVEYEEYYPTLGAWLHTRLYPSEDGGVSAYFEDVTERKRAEKERDLLLAREWVARAEVAERERISRELHDRVAHSMAVVHQSLQLHQILKDSKPSQAAAKMTLAQGMAKTALESTRNLSMELRCSEAEEGLVPALQDLLKVAVPPGIRAELHAEGDESRVPPHVRGQLFAILREGVRNAVAHSGAGHVSVGLDITPDEAVCSVEDDGRGLPGENDGNGKNGGDAVAGVGLRSMRERAGLLGGDFCLSSSRADGTRVEVTVPLNGGR